MRVHLLDLKRHRQNPGKLTEQVLIVRVCANLEEGWDVDVVRMGTQLSESLHVENGYLTVWLSDVDPRVE